MISKILDKFRSSEKSNFGIINFGVACGVVAASFVFVLGFVAWLFDLGDILVADIGSFYFGFKDTFVGILVGLLWSFVDGFILGVLLAFVYNKLQNYKPRPKEESKIRNFFKKKH